jgi:hypothetical protein
VDKEHVSDCKCILIFPIVINGSRVFTVQIFALLTVFVTYIIKQGMSLEIKLILKTPHKTETEKEISPSTSHTL